jgi:hypothetical protein
MLELEDEKVREHRLLLSPEDQTVFMMSYECFVMWCLREGMQSLLNPGEIESGVMGMQGHFAKHAWYQPEAFEKIWDKMCIMMPKAMSLVPPFPLAEMIMAVQAAGYSFEIVKLTSLQFGMYLGCKIPVLVELGRSFAADYPELIAESNPAPEPPSKGWT